MYLSRLVFIYSSQKRELFVVNTSVFVQSTISLKIETKFSWGEEKKIIQMETGWLIKWLMRQYWLTGSSSGGAFPECVLEGNFSHALPHFLSFFCEQEKKCMMDLNHQNSMLILKTSKEGYL